MFAWDKIPILSIILHAVNIDVDNWICYVLHYYMSSVILSDIPSTLHILDKKLNRKYIRHALNLVFVLMDMYILLTPFITLVSLNLSGVKTNLSLIFSLIRWWCKSLIRSSIQMLVTYDVSPCIFSRIGVVIPDASW